MSQAPAQQQAPQEQAAPSQLEIGWRIEGGWRYSFFGQDWLERHPGEEDPAFRHAFSLATTFLVGRRDRAGFYSQLRADAFRAPSVVGFPLLGQVRVGAYWHTSHYDDGARTSRTSSSDQRCYYGLGYCVVTTTTHTRHYQLPPAWIHGIMYAYLSGRLMHQTLGDVGQDGARAPATGVGAALGGGYLRRLRNGLMMLTELELQRYFHGWEERSLWGFGLRASLRLGPAFIDLHFVLDAALGSELSLGAGFGFGGA